MIVQRNPRKNEVLEATSIEKGTSHFRRFFGATYVVRGGRTFRSYAYALVDVATSVARSERKHCTCTQRPKHPSKARPFHCGYMCCKVRIRMICFVLNCRGHQHCLVRLLVRGVSGSVRKFFGFGLLLRSERFASQHDFRCFPVACFLSLLVPFFESFQAAHECSVGCFFAHPAVHQLFHDGRMHRLLLRIRLHFGLDLRVFDPSVVRHPRSLVTHRAHARAPRHRPPHRATRARRVVVDACEHNCHRNLLVVDEADADVAGTRHRTLPGMETRRCTGAAACTSERASRQWAKERSWKMRS